MSMTYASWLYSVASLMVVDPSDANALAMAPDAINYAEQRIYRDLDLLNSIVRDQTGKLTLGSRDFTFPQHFVVSEGINVFTPSNTTQYRQQLIPVSREFLDAVYPDEAALGCGCPSVPRYYAMITDQTIIVGPAPDNPYTVEVIGTVRPVPLSASNPTTYLTLYLPDLFLAASMIFAAGYQQNFSAVGDNPQQAMTWEQQYQALKASADVEELRKKYAAQAWTSKQPTQLATPPRN